MNNGMLPPTIGSKKHSQYEEAGIAAGHFMARPDIAKYNYHIDLGGGGGTTRGPVPLKSSLYLAYYFIILLPPRIHIHDRLKPWKHYILVSPDVQYLRQKFDWAESQL